jgi:N-methylhydantoinase B
MPGALSLEKAGARLRSKGRQVIPAGDCLILDMPGGGGYGDPRRRDPEAVLDDARNGLISLESAEKDYGVKISAGFEIDARATRTLRSA